jgi:roadblock/LC7 domain-containing protein
VLNSLQSFWTFSNDSKAGEAVPIAFMQGGSNLLSLDMNAKAYAQTKTDNILSMQAYNVTGEDYSASWKGVVEQ